MRHFGPHDIEECHWHLAPCIDVDFVFSDERSVVDDTASIEPFNDELNTVLSEIAASQDEVKKLKTEALPQTDSPAGENDTGSKKSSDVGNK